MAMSGTAEHSHNPTLQPYRVISP